MNRPEGAAVLPRTGLATGLVSNVSQIRRAPWKRRAAALA
jgi:hypothetical protein